MAEDALEEILHFLAEKEQRVLGRSLAKRYHQQVEPLLIKEIIRIRSHFTRVMCIQSLLKTDTETNTYFKPDYTIK